MMQRRYFFARALGNPDSVLQRIKTVVLRSGQAAQVPIVKLERKARGQFYVFLGVDCDQSYRIPRPLPENLRAIGLRFEEGHSLQPNDIVNMVQGGIDIHVFDSLQKRTWANDDPGDPFDRSEAWQAQEDSSESCGRFERMLGWLSARGEGNWEAFRESGHDPWFVRAQAGRALSASAFVSTRAHRPLRRRFRLVYFSGCIRSIR